MVMTSSNWVATESNCLLTAISSISLLLIEFSGGGGGDRERPSDDEDEAEAEAVVLETAAVAAVAATATFLALPPTVAPVSLRGGQEEDPVERITHFVDEDFRGEALVVDGAEDDKETSFLLSSVIRSEITGPCLSTDSPSSSSSFTFPAGIFLFLIEVSTDITVAELRGVEVLSI